MRKIALIAVVMFAASVFIPASAQAALLGLSANLALPDITSNATGTYSYTAATDLFTTSATPLSITFDGVTPIAITGTRSYFASFNVDSSGNFVSGITGDDLIIIGDIDVDGDSFNDYSGVLLTGEVTDFGWLDTGIALSFDHFDFTFDVTGGALAGFFNPSIGGGDFMTAEISDFVGDFTVDSSGTKTKHDTTPLVPEPASMLLFGMGLLGYGGRMIRKKFMA